MKKVLIATNSLNIGGAETNIIELATGLKQTGLYDPIIVSNGGKLVKTLADKNIKHYKIHLNNKNPFYYIPTILKLNKIIKKEKIDLIHSHARIPSIICNYLSKKNKLPLVTSVHYPFKLNFLYRHISKWGDKTIAVSKDLKEYVLKNYKIKNKDVSIVINGIDTDKFNGESSYDDIILKYNLRKKANRIVHISRLDKTTSKTVDILIELFEDLNKEINSLELIIVGDGAEYKRLLNKAQSINKKLKRNAIVFTGNISDGINKFDSLATLFIGVSRSAFEAMSSKKPVILSGNQGYLGLFTEDKLKKAVKTNFCCRNEKPVTHKLLKKDILNFFKNIKSKERISIGKYNRDVILKYYSKKTMVDDTAKIYDSLLKKYKKKSGINKYVKFLVISLIIIFSILLLIKVNIESRYKLVMTMENCQGDAYEYINYYLNRFLLNETYQKENSIEILENKIYQKDKKNVWEIKIKFDNLTKYDGYTYVFIYDASDTFYRMMYKYDAEDKFMDYIINYNINNFEYYDDIGMAKDNNYYPIISQNWNEETLELYKKITNYDSILWGIFVRDMEGSGINNDIPVLEEKLDYKFDVVLNYFHLNQDVPVEFLNEAYEQNKIVELTMQTTTSNNTELYGVSPLLEIYKGNYDDKIKEFARAIKDFGHPILFRLNNEMNSDWTSYSGVVNLSDPEIYISVYRRIYDIFEKEGVDNAIWIFNPNNENYPPNSWNNFLNYYPGNEYVHLIGVTGYNTGTYYDDPSQKWREFRYIYNSIEMQYYMFNKFPWIITEFSSSSIGGNKEKWIENMFNNISKFENIKIAVWFSLADYDVNGQVARPYWLDETEETLNAFKQGLKNYK